jgi:hypothetical protein
MDTRVSLKTLGIGMGILVVSLYFLHFAHENFATLEPGANSEMLLRHIVKTLEAIKKEANTTYLIPEDKVSLMKTQRALYEEASVLYEWYRTQTVAQKVNNAEVIETPQVRRIIDETNQAIQAYQLKVLPIVIDKPVDIPIYVR